MKRAAIPILLTTVVVLMALPLHAAVKKVMYEHFTASW